MDKEMKPAVGVMTNPSVEEQAVNAEDAGVDSAFGRVSVLPAEVLGVVSSII